MGSNQLMQSAWRGARVVTLGLSLILLAGCSGELAPDPIKADVSDLTKRESNDPSGESSRPNSYASNQEVLVPFAEQLEYSPRSTELEYALDPGSRLIYSVETNIRLNDGTESILLGVIEYKPLSNDPSHVLAEAETERESEGTGTGFVVHPDGYLVTCAHVVEGATKLDVTLGGKTYPAKVVDMETNHDLALIRIDAHGLTPLPLMNSNDVQLAEEVRVVGFPLSDLLGNSLKVNRGIVSGIDKERADRGFQIDAQINPGNSGGPVVTEKGQVAGVASALLSGEGLSNVGFAVPANQVRQMLQRQPIRYQEADPTEPYLRGPELAQRVTPSVAFLKVKVGPDGIGIAETRSMSFSAALRPHKRRLGTLFPSGSSWQTEKGHLLTDPFGSLSFNDGENHLPGFVGLVSSIGLEHMPGSDEEQWERMGVRLIPQKRETQILVPDNSFPTPSLIPRYGFGRFDRPRLKTVNLVDVHPALEHSSYRIVSRSGSEIEIEKDYEMATIHDESKTPFMKHSGKAKILFDKNQGCLTSVEYSGTVDITVEGTTVNFPLKYSCKLKEKQDLAAPSSSSEVASNLPSSTSPTITSSNKPRPEVKPPAPRGPKPPKDLPKVEGLTLLDLSE